MFNIFIIIFTLIIYQEFDFPDLNYDQNFLRLYIEDSILVPMILKKLMVTLVTYADRCMDGRGTCSRVGLPASLAWGRILIGLTSKSKKNCSIIVNVSAKCKKSVTLSNHLI